MDGFDVALYVYIYKILGNLLNWLWLFVVIGWIAFGIGALIEAADSPYGEEPKYLKSYFGKYITRAVWVTAGATALSVLYPDTETLKLMAGGWGITEIATMPEAQEIPENILGAINAFLEGVQEGE